MYLPPHFKQPDTALLPSADGSHLHGHVARASPLTHLDGARVLAVFHGPHAYVSPSWYPSRPVRAVPTWNYAVVHAHGRLTCQNQSAWLERHLAAVSQRFEGGLAEPWQLHAAPAEFIERMQSAVVGIDISVERLEGKFKLSQNRSAEDRWGVIEALNAAAGGRHPLSRWMWVGTEQG